MGEYAEYNGRIIKIGTCESMTGLTAEQAPLVTKVPNSIDPIREAESIRFRFPFPDEDGSQPGQPADYNRAVPIPGFTIDPEARHYGKHPECATAEVAVTQQKVVDGILALVACCSVCHAAYRLPTLDDAADHLAALYTAALSTEDPEQALLLAGIAERVMDGYVSPPEWVARRSDLPAFNLAGHPLVSADCCGVILYDSHGDKLCTDHRTAA